MVKPFPSKTHIGNYMLHPETLMPNYGYDPQPSEGAVKLLVFLTLTLVFRTAEDGQDFFDFTADMWVHSELYSFCEMSITRRLLRQKFRKPGRNRR